jgi:transcriptional regulator with XRE-family HTH domain
MNNLKDIRKKAGLTLEALSLKCESSKGGLHDLESGVSQPTIARAYRIANALGVDVYRIWPDKSSRNRKMRVAIKKKGV